ncbi:type II secretion system protein [bacterium]|jgi:type II secretory pathway pseudopilin PulG|nr:type II secretion system protein [bacterium]MBT6832321.1 type II secretion system protein [bacterium]MBT6996766.1 type II secretion system protein [bacterium]MBT7772821.1 type II secretion system protein [bacterium]
MKNKNPGYALLEVIVSIVILSATLSATVGLMWVTSSASERNRDQITAMYLAQECLEVSRNVRDSAWRQHLPWNCAFGIGKNTASCSDLKKEMTAMRNEKLVEIGDKKTKFDRSWDTKFDGKEKVKITCTVEWSLRSGKDQVQLSHILTDWRKK